jgi:hypothetical protein
MTRGIVVLWCVVLMVAGGAAGVGGARQWNARSRAQSELVTLAALRQQSAELTALRAGAPTWTRQGRPPTGLTPRITAALAACGMPASVMSSVSPEAESALGEADLRARRSKAVLTLAPVTLPQLGAFLEAWRSREPQWTVGGIELWPQSAGAKAESAGGDLPLRAVLGLERLFVEQPEAAKGAFVMQTGGGR